MNTRLKRKLDELEYASSLLSIAKGKTARAAAMINHSLNNQTTAHFKSIYYSLTELQNTIDPLIDQVTKELADQDLTTND